MVFKINVIPSLDALNNGWLRSLLVVFYPCTKKLPNYKTPIVLIPFPPWAMKIFSLLIIKRIYHQQGFRLFCLQLELDFFI